MCDSCQKDWDATRAERDRLREALRDLYRLIVYDDGTLFEVAPSQRERVEDVLRRAAVLVEVKP